MVRLFLATLLLSGFLMSCSKETPEISTPQEPMDFLDSRIEELLDVVEANSINRYDIDWEKAREEVHEVRNDGSFQDAVERLLEILGDNHSFYVSNTNTYISASNVSCDEVLDYSRPELSDVAYVKLLSFSGDENASIEYAEIVQQEIRSQDEESIVGWVVDLSDNSGGNMWPMIAGLGPLLGESVLGHFIDPDKNETSWGYRNGASYINSSNNEIVKVQDPYQVINPDKKIAVIIDGPTASSGEATTIAFIGKENVRFFGQPTCGLSTANQSFRLEGGAQIFLTVSNMADKDKNEFGFPILPNVNTTSVREINAAIVEWFEE